MAPRSCALACTGLKTSTGCEEAPDRLPAAAPEHLPVGNLFPVAHLWDEPREQCGDSIESRTLRLQCLTVSMSDTAEWPTSAFVRTTCLPRRGGCSAVASS